jgi:hypothetical protein
MCATWLVRIVLLDLMPVMILGEEYKLQSSSLCNFPYQPTIYFFVQMLSVL